jgi:DeoR/GlpR family transcriptional regulator of sugar metabolism
MLARQRQERILEEVRAHGGARVSDLVELLDVSDMTVRRDIEALARRGLVARVHGGATAVSARSAEEPGFDAKFLLQTAQKAAIARSAAAFVPPGASVAISAGTTTYAVALELREVPDLTVVTNSIPVADALHRQRRDGLTVLLTGGTRTPSDALVGPVAVAALRTLHVDWLFLGVHGVDERAGLTTPNLVEAETNRALIASARRVVVTADSTKWGVVGLSSMARLDDVDVLVTDDGLDPEAARVVRSRVGQLVLAPIRGEAATGTHDGDDTGDGTGGPGYRSVATAAPIVREDR